MPTEKLADSSGQEMGDFVVQDLVMSRFGVDLFVAQAREDAETVFLAVCKATASQSPEQARRFERRMETVAQLRHPGIASVLETGTLPSGQPYAVMEYVETERLSERLEESIGEPQLKPVDALRLASQLAELFSVAHPAGIIHSDLRPENILLRDDGYPYLVDLGIPAGDEPAVPVTDMFRAGALDYASPEQIQGKALSGQSNVYSLGILLYELLAGHRPAVPVSSWDIFDPGRTELPRATPLRHSRSGLAPETYRLVRDCLWLEEWNRFETIDSMLEAIDQAAIAELEAEARLGKSPVRRRVLFAVPPLFVLILVAGITLFADPGEGVDGEIQTPQIEATETLSAASETAQAQEPTATIDAPPTATEATRQAPVLAGAIEILAPSPETQLVGGENVDLIWKWETALGRDEQFRVYLYLDNETRLVGTITEPEGPDQYLLTLTGRDTMVAGTQFWQVFLEGADSSDVRARSALTAITFLPGATPTPSATPFPTSQSTTATIPSASPTTSLACQPNPPSGWVLYRVTFGDTLFGLAVSTGVTVNRVREVNCLQGTVLSVGSELWLPTAPIGSTPSGQATATPSGSNPPPPPPPTPQRPTLTPPPPPG